MRGDRARSNRIDHAEKKTINCKENIRKKRNEKNDNGNQSDFNFGSRRGRFDSVRKKRIQRKDRGSNSEIYPEAEVVEIKVSVEGDKLTVKRVTAGITSVYVLAGEEYIEGKSSIYVLKDEEGNDAGYATVGVTSYHDGSEQYTLIIRTGERYEYFSEKITDKE